MALLRDRVAAPITRPTAAEFPVAKALVTADLAAAASAPVFRGGRTTIALLILAVQPNTSEAKARQVMPYPKPEVPWPIKAFT